MSNIRNRLDELKKKKGIQTDSDLLRMMHEDLYIEGKTQYKDPKEFVK